MIHSMRQRPNTSVPPLIEVAAAAVVVVVVVVIVVAVL